jgi:hypothetical protein
MESIRVLRGVLFLVLVVGVFGCARWKEVTSADGKFVVTAPGRPIELPIDLPSDRGIAMTGTQYRWEPRLSNKSYVAMYLDIAITNPDVGYDYDKGLGNVIDGILRRGTGVLSPHGTAYLAGHQAIDVQTTSPQKKLTMRVQGFRRESRFYILFMGWAAGSDPGSDRDRFFRSFRLL